MRTLLHQQIGIALLFWRFQHSKWEINKQLFIFVSDKGAWTSIFFCWHFNVSMFCWISFDSNHKEISQRQRTKYNLNPKNLHICSQVKIEAKGLWVQHKQDVTHWIGRVLHHFPHFAIHLLTGCNEMHPDHLEEMHTPPPTTAGTPNDWTVFIPNLKRCKCSKMMLLKKTLTNKGATFLLSANYKLHWDVVAEWSSTAAAGGPVLFYLPLSTLQLSR